MRSTNASSVLSCNPPFFTSVKQKSNLNRQMFATLIYFLKSASKWCQVQLDWLTGLSRLTLELFSQVFLHISYSDCMFHRIHLFQVRTVSFNHVESKIYLCMRQHQIYLFSQRERVKQIFSFFLGSDCCASFDQVSYFVFLLPSVIQLFQNISLYTSNALRQME